MMLEKAAKIAEEIGYPVIIKAALGGGGQGNAGGPEAGGIRDAVFRRPRRKRRSAFGDNTMYIEHFVQHPRHIEFQILADSYGNVIHLGERDCSIQRSHQKMMEEAPSSALIR